MCITIMSRETPAAQAGIYTGYSRTLSHPVFDVGFLLLFFLALLASQTNIYIYIYDSVCVCVCTAST